MANDPRIVFVNVPFDSDFAPLFEALVFTITACGYRVRCALEEEDSGDIRLDKLVKLIAESPRSIHDLSRIEIGENLLPRFNMPFELGLALGAKRFGRSKRNANTLKIMVGKPFVMPAYLSDLAGNDPEAHHNNYEAIIKIVRNYLHQSPQGTLLPGPKNLASAFTDFGASLPKLAAALRFDPDEIGGFKHYRTYMWCVTEFLRST